MRKFVILVNAHVRTMTSGFFLCSSRWRRKRTSARISRGNTAHEANRVSPEHSEFIGLLYYEKSHVPCSGVCKERGLTQLPEEKERTGTVDKYGT